MNNATYSVLVENALKKRAENERKERIISLSSENFAEGKDTLLYNLANDLNNINKHISIDESILENASNDYDEIALHLIRACHINCVNP